MSDVFISYSRRDIDFVRHLFDQLKARDRDAWADWLAEIYRGIEAANTFLFVISPDSVTSEICTLEIGHAVKHNKRLVPVVWKDADDVHQAMSAHNWVFLRQEDDFEANFELLVDALDTDLEYVKEHTRLLTRAIEWDQKYQKNSGELRDQELLVAEAWLAVSGLKEPSATDLQRDYITYSRQKSDNQRTEMEETVRISTSRALAAFALVEMETDPELSLLLATKSIRIMSEANETVLPLSNSVLRQSLVKSRVRLTLSGHDDQVNSAAYNPDGKRIASVGGGGIVHTPQIWVNCCK